MPMLPFRLGLLALGIGMRFSTLAQQPAPLLTPTTAATSEVATTTCWLEGPAAAADGSLYFSDVQHNCLYQLTAQGQRTVYRASANYPNGTALDAQGRLLVCEAGDPATGLPPRLTRTDLATGRVAVLAAGYAGREFQGPEDVRVASDGRIYFTDGVRPAFIPPRPASGPPNPVGLYCLDPAGHLRRVLGPSQLAQPNGLAIAPDGRWLYVLENNPQPGGLRQLLRFALSPGGEATGRQVLHDFYPGRSGDGMLALPSGELLVAAGLNRPRHSAETLAVAAGIYRFSPGGQLLGFAPIGEDSVTNIAQSPQEADLFFVTAGHTVFQLRWPATAAGQSK